MDERTREREEHDAVSGAPDSWPLSAREAALELGISERTVRRAIARGALPADKRAGVYRIAPDDLARYRVGRPTGFAPRTENHRTPPRLISLPRPKHASAPALPRPLTSLIDREREIAAVRALLLRADPSPSSGQAPSPSSGQVVRLVTLTGPGGVGKTRLALRVAEELAEHYPDGIWFVSLAPIHDPDLVPAAIARALGVREIPDRPLAAGLTAFLRDKHALLLLDNFEHLLEAAALVSDLLATCPHLEILVTSRAVLHLSGEHGVVVPPLTLPELARLQTLDDLHAAPAVRLFVERARAARDDFALTEANATAVVQICHRLDGLPLAIELAAARSSLLPPPALLARLEPQLSLLTGGPRDTPARLRTMRDAIAWSHDLLNDDERTLFHRLAVFVGGCTLDAAEAVCEGRGTEYPRTGDVEGTGEEYSRVRPVFDGIASLVDKSLLRREEGPDGSPRFGMLETIHEFGLEQLAASGELEATCHRHALYYVALAETAQAKIGGAEEGPWLARLDAELANVRAALRWATASEPVLALKLWTKLRRYWFTRGYLREGREALERALDAASTGAVPAPLRAQVLNALGWLALHLGAFDAAVEWLEEEVELRRAVGDRLGLAQALHGLAAIAEYRGDDVTATTRYEAALALSRAIENRAMVVEMLDSLADAALRGNDVERAVLLAGEALAISRETGVPTMTVVMALVGATQIACARGDYPKAGVLLREALERAGAAGYRLGIADALAGCAAVAVAGGQAEHAARLLAATTALAEVAGSSRVLHQTQFERALAAARAELDGPAFAGAWAAGRTLAPHEAIDEALAVVSPDPVVSREPVGAIANHSLTPRELDVVRLLAEGKSDREIAAVLFVSRRTAATHVASIFRKLGVTSRAAAAAYAVRHGIA
jgi:non-specific serine/threonine protein kinase